MARKSELGLVEAIGPDIEIVERKPKLIVPLGRGRTGKTTFDLWSAGVAECDAGKGGGLIRLGDADRNNATLSAFRPDALRPEYSDNESIKEWLNGVIERQVEEGFSFYLDLAGGDALLKEYAQELDLVSFCESVGIEPVAVHFLGSSEDDLCILNDIETSGVFVPERTILVLNEGILPPGAVALRAFAPIIDNPIFQSALGRGARSVIMPRLTCMKKLEDARLQFHDVVSGRVKTLLTTRQLVKIWLREMDKAFADVRNWLP